MVVLRNKRQRTLFGPGPNLLGYSDRCPKKGKSAFGKTKVTGIPVSGRVSSAKMRKIVSLLAHRQADTNPWTSVQFRLPLLEGKR